MLLLLQKDHGVVVSVDADRIVVKTEGEAESLTEMVLK